MVLIRRALVADEPCQVWNSPSVTDTPVRTISTIPGSVPVAAIYDHRVLGSQPYISGFADIEVQEAIFDVEWNVEHLLLVDHNA